MPLLPLLPLAFEALFSMPRFVTRCHCRADAADTADFHADATAPLMPLRPLLPLPPLFMPPPFSPRDALSAAGFHYFA
jgi:hypothetical protein